MAINFIRRCPVCNKRRHVVVDRNCCGNDLLITSPQYEQIIEFQRKLEEKEKRLIKQFVLTENGRITTIMIDPNKKKYRKKLPRSKKPTSKKKRVSDPIRNAVIKRDKGVCTKCGSKNKLHVHHIKPRNKGGTDKMDNLTTLCDICHAEEHRGERVYNIMVKSLLEYKTISSG